MDFKSKANQKSVEKQFAKLVKMPIKACSNALGAVSWQGPVTLRDDRKKIK